jgi:hypothetical protein
MGMPYLPLGAGIDSTRHDSGLSSVNLDDVSLRMVLLSSTDRFQLHVTIFTDTVCNCRCKGTRKTGMRMTIVWSKRSMRKRRAKVGM